MSVRVHAKAKVNVIVKVGLRVSYQSHCPGKKQGQSQGVAQGH